MSAVHGGSFGNRPVGAGVHDTDPGGDVGGDDVGEVDALPEDHAGAAVRGAEPHLRSMRVEWPLRVANDGVADGNHECAVLVQLSQAVGGSVTSALCAR